MPEMAAGSGPVCYVTTVGRVSGRAHRVDIWYLDRNDCVYLLSGYGARADWVQNMLAQPAVTVEIPVIGSTARTVVEAYVADVGPVDDELAIREAMDVRYHGWSPGQPLSSWARESLLVRLRRACR